MIRISSPERGRADPFHDLFGCAKHSSGRRASPMHRLSEKIDCLPSPAAWSSDLAQRDLLPAGPGRELVDLGRELVEIVTDDVDERPARIDVGFAAEGRETLGDHSGSLRFATL